MTRKSQTSEERLVDFFSMVGAVARDVVRRARDPRRVIHSERRADVRHESGGRDEVDARDGVVRAVGFAKGETEVEDEARGQCGCESRLGERVFSRRVLRWMIW